MTVWIIDRETETALSITANDLLALRETIDNGSVIELCRALDESRLRCVSPTIDSHNGHVIGCIIAQGLKTVLNETTKGVADAVNADRLE